MDRRLRRGLLVALAAWCAAAGCAAQAGKAPSSQPGVEAAVDRSPVTVRERFQAEGDVTVARLSNGLTAIVKRTSQAPVVCVRCYVRAGSLYEGQWLGAGISHLAEHLVAEGATHDMGESTDKSVAQTSGRTKEIGGQSNAYTGPDHTCYYISAAAGKAMDCVDIVADWMARPKIAPEDFQREHGVVQRELETGRDQPDRRVAEAHQASFYGTHPAGVPVIGFPGPLGKLTYEDLLAYHRRMYVPQNMVFVVVGDIDVEAVLARTCKAMAGFEEGRSPDLSLPEVPAWSGVRRAAGTHGEIKDVIERISFRTVPLLHRDLHALDVLSYVLTEGQASRLVQKVRREARLVTSVSSSSWTPAWGDGMFTVSFRSEPDKADQAEQAITGQLKALAEEGPSNEELQRAKRQKVADFVYSQQTVESVSATLATDYLTTGDVNFSRRYTDRIQAVTAEEVQSAARKYFTFDAMAVTRLTPPGAGEQAPETGGQPARPAAKAEAFTLANGLRVVLKPIPEAGVVSMVFVSKGGLLVETPETNGLGTLMTSLATKGAGGRSAEEIARFFDRAGGGISSECGNNSFYWQATVLDDSFAEALDILADIVIRPDLGGKELEILRPVKLNAISRQEEDWQGKLSKFFRKEFFTNSPFGMLPSGSAEVVGAATAEQVAEHQRKCILAGSSVLAICGSFDPQAARQRAEELFVQLRPGSVELPAPPRRAVSTRREWHTLDVRNDLAAITVAAPGMKVSDLDDRLPIDVLDTIISGWRMPGGWLHDELRGRQLVYVVHAYNWVGLAPGAFTVYAACQPDKADEVTGRILTDLDRASQYEPTQKEVDLAVNTILTAELLENQEPSSLAMSAGLDELYGLGYDFRDRLEQQYKRVTPAEVLRVARKYLTDGFVIAVTTPKASRLSGAAKE